MITRMWRLHRGWEICVIYKDLLQDVREWGTFCCQGLQILEFNCMPRLPAPLSTYCLGTVVGAVVVLLRAGNPLKVPPALPAPLST